MAPFAGVNKRTRDTLEVVAEQVANGASSSGKNTRMVRLNGRFYSLGIWPHHHFAAEASAYQVGDVARAAQLEDGQQVSLSHGERDAHRLFNRFGFALKVPISNLEVPGEQGEHSVSIPYLKVQDYFKFLAKNHPCLLFGGESDGGDLCQSFWTEYQHEHPEHCIFQQFPNQVDWRRILPICLHGDKGRTLKKSPILLLSWESVFGLPPNMRGAPGDRKRKVSKDSKLHWDCEKRITHCKRPVPDTLASYDVDFEFCTKNQKLNTHGQAAIRSTAHDSVVAGMMHNQKGSTYLSRFFFCALPSKLYKQNSGALPRILKEMALNIRDQWDTGIQVSNTVYRLGFIGVKGDLEFHQEAGQFDRCYANVGTAKDLAMCPECLAGMPGFNFTDVSNHPAWLDTVGTVSPWGIDAEPPLHCLPFMDQPDPTMYRRDPFHLLKFGFARDLAAGLIVQLCSLEYFDIGIEAGDSRSVEERLGRAFGHFDLWCLASSKQKHLKSFTRENLKFAKNSSLPFLSAKGADVTLVLTWLSFVLTGFFEDPLHQDHVQLLSAMQQTTQGFLDYIGVMHSHGLWLPRCCAKVLSRAGFRLLKGYCYLADYSVKNKLIGGYNLRPKLHYFHHSLMDLQKRLQDPTVKWFLNPNCWNCEANEDYIGRQARISRRVDARTCSLRTLQRYLVKVRAVIARARA